MLFPLSSCSSRTKQHISLSSSSSPQSSHLSYISSSVFYKCELHYMSILFFRVNYCLSPCNMSEFRFTYCKKNFGIQLSNIKILWKWTLMMSFDGFKTLKWHANCANNYLLVFYFSLFKALNSYLCYLSFWILNN